MTNNALMFRLFCFSGARPTILANVGTPKIKFAVHPKTGSKT